MNSESKSYSAGGGISTGGAGPTGNVGMGRSSARRDRAWTDNVSSITGTESVNINVAGNTHIKGAKIANEDENGNDGGNLTLTTNSLSYENIEDYDNSESSGFNIGFSSGTSGGLSGSTEIGMQNTGSMKQGITRATIGLGNIVVAENSESIEGLNRDIDNVQETTKDLTTGALEIKQAKE